MDPGVSFKNHGDLDAPARKKEFTEMALMHEIQFIFKENNFSLKCGDQKMKPFIPMFAFIFLTISIRILYLFVPILSVAQLSNCHGHYVNQIE